MAFRRVAIVKGGGAVGWRVVVGLPVRVLAAVLVLLAGEEYFKGSFSAPSKADCERAFDDAPSTADAMTFAAEARPLRLGTL